MLVIKPIDDKNFQKELVTLCGGTYKESALAYAAHDCEDDGETIRFPIGVCQFTLSGKDGVIDTLKPCPGIEDEEAMMIMTRACTAFLFRCGFTRAVVPQGGADPSLLQKLGFTASEDGTSVLDVMKYYTSPCHGEQ